MFVKYFTKNITEQEKLEKYCNSKPEIWRWFFGWRGTKNDTMCYKISKKVLEKILGKKIF